MATKLKKLFQIATPTETSKIRIFNQDFIKCPYCHENNEVQNDAFYVLKKCFNCDNFFSFSAKKLF